MVAKTKIPASAGDRIPIIQPFASRLLIEIFRLVVFGSG
jgi:hypothetical protein